MYKRMLNMALSSVFEKHMALINALTIYLVFMIIIDYVNLNNIVYVKGNADIDNGLLLFITALANWIIYIMVAISTHRILILGEDSIPKWGLYKFTKREWSFMFNGFLLGLLMMFVAFSVLSLSASFDSIGFILSIAIIGVVLSIIVSRVSLVFPSISVDKAMTFSDAWTFTKQYKLFVFVSVVLFPLLFSFVFGFVYGLAIKLISSIIHYELFFLFSVLNIVIAVITVSALSATYKIIIEEHPEYLEPDNKEEKVEIRETTVISNDKNHKIVIHDKGDVTFEDLQEKLKSQYSKLGFTNTVIDKDRSWMIKNPQDNDTYVLLSHRNSEYVIEVFQNEMIDFLDQLIVHEN
ncbi:hypothetical protein WCX72_05990 [Sulfurimonas sp. HSL1-6]|uniref:hypothetical protein n=2 Tax=Sulfurimonadaceae TaxID=2771471 RepID=UPI0031F958BA